MYMYLILMSEFCEYGLYSFMIFKASLVVSAISLVRSCLLDYFVSFPFQT